MKWQSDRLIHSFMIDLPLHVLYRLGHLSGRVEGEGSDPTLTHVEEEEAERPELQPGGEEKH